MGRLTGGDPSLLRRINSAVVLHSLRGAESTTLTGLTRITGLSRPTVEGVVEGLIEAGLVVECVPEEGGTRRQGRPARRFRFRAEAGHLLGIEIGSHRVAALLSGLDGRIIGAGSREVSETADEDERLERVRAVVADVLRRSGVARSSLRAVGVGSPGIVESDGTVRLGTALPGWTGLALGERLRRSFRCPVLVENDANAAAVAEHWKGAATDSDDIVFVLAGLSPGAGSLIGGRLHRGYGGAAGEIGALHLLGRGATPKDCCRPRTSRCIRWTSRPSQTSSRWPRAATNRPSRQSTGSSSAWCTMWRRWSWRSIRSWWWSGAGRPGWTVYCRRCAASWPATVCGRLAWCCPCWARRPWRRVRCGWRSTMSRSSCSRSRER